MSTLDKVLTKTEFNIQDLAEKKKRKTQTIRSWEKKGIISEADKRDHNKWRLYSKQCFIEVLQQILDHPWERQVIKNVAEVEYVINELVKSDVVEQVVVDEQ